MAEEKPFFIGAKTIEELEARDAARQETPPVEPTPPTEKVVETPKEVTPPTEQKIAPTPPSNTWLDEVNKTYKTEFKTPEDFGKHLERAKRADELEPKITEYTNNELKYQKQLKELQSSLNPLEYFSSQEAFVAEQLKKQHPDKNPRVLQEIVSSDFKVMDDLDVLIKDALLTTPGLKGGEAGVRETILSEFGINDLSIPKEEWPISVQNRIMIKANQARKQWDELKTNVVLPKISTPEEREAERVRLATEKKAQLIPLKETFSKFDKFTEQIEEGKIFEFNVTDEYKKVLPEMFETYFVEAGITPDADSLASMEKLKRALFLEGNFKQIYKTIEADVESRMKADRDKLLGNENPPNTKSGMELESDDRKKFSNEHGLGKLFNKK